MHNFDNSTDVCNHSWHSVRRLSAEHGLLTYCVPKLMDWIANPDNGAILVFFDLAHVALMRVLLATTLVGNSSRQKLRFISMDVE